MTAPKRTFDRHSWMLGGVLLGLAALLWAPRMSGPIDLRYDAGVYYLLGSSLAAGEGYRIGSEPGAPVGIQYPPALPALVAVHQWMLGTSDVEVVGPWLRRTYALIFAVFTLAVFALGRRWLGPWGGAAATVACMLQVNTYLLSDLLFTELPFALVSVLLALWVHRGAGKPSTIGGEGVGFLLGAVGFLLRSAGIALLFAWVAEALCRKRFRLAGVRALLALLPFAAWQAHVLWVQSSADYREPAYAYQRAPYQFYNVSYAENMRLKNPFEPEAGRLDAATLSKRIATQLLEIPIAAGEAVSEGTGFWLAAFDAVFRDATRGRWPTWLASVPFVIVAALATWGLGEWVRRRNWFVAAFVGSSIVLVCTTPWPGQFLRYLSPLTPFLAVAAVMGFLRLFSAAQQAPARWARRLISVAMIGSVIAAFSVQGYALMNSFRVRHFSPSFAPETKRQWNSPRWFYHESPWHRWSEAVKWIAARAPADAVVATDAPHLVYLRTGLKSVLPPMEVDPSRASELLAGVPVQFVIVDELTFLDASRRYAEPAMTGDPERWTLVHEIGATRIYQFQPGIHATERNPTP